MSWRTSMRPPASSRTVPAGISFLAMATSSAGLSTMATSVIAQVAMNASLGPSVCRRIYRPRRIFATTFTRHPSLPITGTGSVPLPFLLSTSPGIDDATPFPLPHRGEGQGEGASPYTFFPVIEMPNRQHTLLKHLEPRRAAGPVTVPIVFAAANSAQGYFRLGERAG